MAISAKFNRRSGINMSEKMYEEVKRLADAQGVSNAEIIRQAVEAGLPALRAEQLGNAPVRE